ncbi:hypothetical protein FKP32DRAFT_1586771 [Trametes sanguinea]|nr:hypothetical protein FKP32DRAFT_1586771 [Trametes sanguinea]
MPGPLRLRPEQRKGAPLSASIKICVKGIHFKLHVHIAAMVARIATCFIAFVAATVVGGNAVPRGSSSTSCDTGTIVCCASLIEPPANSQIPGLVGIACSPADGASCSIAFSEPPVCCQGTLPGGIASFGCEPIVP